MNCKSNRKKNKKKIYGPLRMRTVHLPEKRTGVWQMVHLQRRKYWYENNRCLMNGTSSKKDAYEKDEWQMVHLPQIKMYKKKMGVWWMVHLPERKDVYERIPMVHLPEKKDGGLI